MRATKFGEDSIKPLLVGFELDMTLLQLTLEFDETVESPTNIVCGKFAFMSGATFVRLAKGSTNSAYGTKVVITIDVTDADRLKLERAVVSRENDTVLALGTGAIVDAVGNTIDAVNKSVALAGCNRDGTEPKLANFAVNVDDSEITLNFDEPVDASSLKPKRFTLLPNALNTSKGHTLTGGSTESKNGRVIVLAMTVKDMNAIKQDDGLCASLETAFLQIDAGAVLDTSTATWKPTDVPPAAGARHPVALVVPDPHCQGVTDVSAG